MTSRATCKTPGPSLKGLAEDALDWIKSRSLPGVEVEVYLSRSESRGLELREGALDGFQQSASEGIGLRVLQGGRMAFGCAGGLDLDVVKSLFEKVSSHTHCLPSDPLRGFPGPGKPGPEDKKLQESLCDETLFTEPLEKIIPRLEEAEAEVLRSEPKVKRVIRSGYDESRGEVVIANSKGLYTAEKGTSAGFGISALAGEGADTKIGSDFQSVRRASDLDFSRAARMTAWRSAVMLGARKLPGGRRSVIFDPWVAGEFLDIVASLLSADQVQRGKSLFAGKLGKKVASGALHIQDDPRRLYGVGSSLFDDEGCPTVPKAMIEGGVVKEYFYDTYTANKDGRPGNASAGRGSFKGLPTPTPSNFFMVPGETSRDDIIGGTKDGILVLDVMGMHTANPISGEFSVGVSGISIKAGRLGHAIKGAMISGNILELLERIDAVGNDLTFYGSMGAPTFRIKHMTVA